METAQPGMVVLFGSGETSPSGRKVFDEVMQNLPAAPRLALLETPAGFELNSAQVIGRVGEFLRQRLQNYRPQVEIVAARRRGGAAGGAYNTDDPQVVAPLLESDLVFMGPGSPSYAVRHLGGSLAWDYLRARQRLGAPLVLASAAVVAISAHALPVYEIYKVGEELHWKDGLDFFGDYGLPLVFIPHWNNNDGGAELDTSCCFMGQERFARLLDLLPPDLTVTGIDEQTALLLDLAAGQCRVMGLGGVTLIHTGHRHPRPGAPLPRAGLEEIAARRGGHVHTYPSGASFPLSQLGALEHLPGPAGLPEAVWQAALAAQARRQAQPPAPEPPALPPEVQALAEARQAARASKDWAASDRLRQQIAALGWQVQDTPDGQKLTPEN